MPSYSTSTPAATIRTNTTPSYSDYQFWIKPSTNEAFFSDGTAWQEIPTGAPATALLSIENALSILEIQAADTITPDTSAQIASEVFSDADGYNGTIDTGNTTASFSSDKYTNKPLSAESTTFATTGSESGTGKSGLKLTTSSACSIVSITKFSSSNATKAYILNSSKGVLATADFSGDVATFATPYDLNASTTYYFAVDKAGASYDSRPDESGVSYPVAQTYWSYTAGLRVTGAEPTNMGYLSSIAVLGSATDSIIQTNALTLPSTPAKFIIFAFRDTLVGTGTIDADISFDNGANYQTGISLNTETTITNAGAQMILKLNLNAGASTGTAEAKGYGVLFW